MKVSTEACILGSYCKHENPTNILDVGTGTGLLAMMLHQKYPQASVTALEIEENTFLQAETNIFRKKSKFCTNLCGNLQK